MFSTNRAIRHHLQHRHLTAPYLPRRSAQRHHLSQLHQLHQRNFITPPHPHPYHPRQTFFPRRSAIDPLSFVVAAAVSAAIAYAATQYTSRDKADAIDTTEPEPIQDLSALSAQYTLVMASQMPPGRPGNLTADQTEKLKEMWAATLEIFGVSNEGLDISGTATPSSETSPDAKKKKKRLSLFKKKDKSVTDASNGADNDKHGQNKEFHDALASQTPEQLRESFWSMAKHDHPDALLLRYLRARKWDVHAALIMMISTMHWRSREMHLDDDIMLHGDGRALVDSKSSNAAEKKEGGDFMSQLRMGKSFLHGCDKDGRPCCYVRARLHRQGEQSERSLERFTVYQIETARMLLRPPVDTATIVFDLTDFSMANMDYTPVKFMIKCFEANYPESLGSVLVYKAPWIFQGIWKIIRGWLDPVVASKVHFASNVDELSEWIPRSKIMKELGGDEDYSYTYIEPREGENAHMSDTAIKDKVLGERKELVNSYESETLSWVHGEDAGEGRLRLAQRLAENYWRLDPYVRAKSLYDRQGVIGAGGKVDFYPTAKSAAAAAAAANGGMDDGVD